MTPVRSPHASSLRLKLMISVALALQLLATGVSAAATPQAEDLGALVTAAKKWLTRALPPQTGGQRSITIQRPDSRLALQKCRRLDFSLPQGNVPAGRLPLLVSCRSPEWHLYLIAKISVMIPVLVSTHALAAGTLLRSSDYMKASRPLGSLLPGTLSRAEDLAGHVLDRNVSSGIALTASMVTVPQCIHPGEHVTIVAKGEHLKLSVGGIAEQAGRPGQLILIKNVTSGRVIRATVTGPGRVQVTF